MELIIVTGLSGAGRRSVLSALEDAGCTAIDNMPVGLLGPLLELEAKLNPIRARLAVGMDNRHMDFATEFAPLLERLSESNLEVYVVFVEADDHTLMRRYSESRRPHYLAGPGTGLAEAFAKERALLAPVRALASSVVDTSRLNLSQLRQRISELVPGITVTETVLRLVSFGFKFGIPEDADMVLDARFLPNPHYVPELRPFTGQDKPVQDFLTKSDDFGTFLARIENWIRWAWPLVLQEGRAYHTVAIGCTGGQHRSVALVELLNQRLQRDIPSLQLSHRELKNLKA
jgi:UPF0042 nucleotide-binding protein